jgi:cytoskeletal protein CcmA (bactofilin family)
MLFRQKPPPNLTPNAVVNPADKPDSLANSPLSFAPSGESDADGLPQPTAFHLAAPPDASFAENRLRPPMSLSSMPINPSASASLPGGRADLPGRRAPDIPSLVGKRPSSTPESDSPEATATSDVRKLVVGREISLSGEIAACDVLVVEGTVEARLKNGRVIEVAKGGLFKGAVEIEDADIAGSFEGDITVRGALRIRASGRITGTIRYGLLEVEPGGRLSGSIEALADRPAESEAAPDRTAEALPQL